MATCRNKTVYCVINTNLKLSNLYSHLLNIWLIDWLKWSEFPRGLGACPRKFCNIKPQILHSESVLNNFSIIFKYCNYLKGARPPPPPGSATVNIMSYIRPTATKLNKFHKSENTFNCHDKTNQSLRNWTRHKQLRIFSDVSIWNKYYL